MNTTIDKKEIEFFSKLTQEWWDVNGPVSSLHKFADARIEFIISNIIRIIPYSETSPLKNLNCIDVGCGGGIISERLKRLGGEVTGIDTSKKLIQIAKSHAKKNRLNINYQCISTSNFIKRFKDLKFDLVIASEVIEHVDNRKQFISDLSKLTRNGGLVVITTLNKSILSVILAKFFAENIVGIIPKGTHDINKFITPQKLINDARPYNIFFDDIVGFVPTFSISNILKREINGFKITSNPIINYGIAGLKID